MNQLSPADAALQSVHTQNLPELFKQLNISLAVSTYQAGKLIMVRRDGDKLNTHFRSFGKPMGMALQGNKLAVGGVNSVWDYRNMPAVAPKLEPAGKHDACFVPRRLHVTGDIDVHEMAYDEAGELWIVNTRFCCLCTVDADHSFHPRWRPHFVSAYAAEDRCHLNGLAMRDGKARYVTALAQTDHAGGWREHKRAGGVIMDVPGQKILAQGLSMPHSPRWHQDRLWVLESGAGTLAVVDPDKGSWQTVAELPGFTRGLSFYGPLAFIGLSQVRESAIFSGIPLVDRVEQRSCGIWVVNILTGQTLGFIRFEAGVQEIFAVEVLPGLQYPDMMEWNDQRLAMSYVLPDEALKEVYTPSEEELRASPTARFQQGLAHFNRKELKLAIEEFRACVEKDASFPNARYNLAVALGDDGQFEEAEKLMREVIAQEPQRAEAYNSLGHICSGQGHSDQAVTHYQRALELQPDYPVAQFNLGMMQLLRGDFANGWTNCEARWKTPMFTPFQCPQPLWDGSDLGDRTLLVHTEQGAGDATQFARYLPMAAKRCGKLIVVCTEAMSTLLAAIEGVAEVRRPGRFAASEFDAYLPILSLPKVFNTLPETVPATIPYIDKTVLMRWRETPSLPAPRFAAPPGQGPNLRVGLVWAGSSTHANDRNRSITLDTLLPVLRTPNVDFFSLQVDKPRAEIGQLPDDINLVDAGSEDGADYTDLALRLPQLDLLISVDTAAAHIAGALALPVWLMLPFAPDWRWGLNTETTPWYPGMRLFRQPERGAWGAVVNAVAAALNTQKLNETGNAQG